MSISAHSMLQSHGWVSGRRWRIHPIRILSMVHHSNVVVRKRDAHFQEMMSLREVLVQCVSLANWQLVDVRVVKVVLRCICHALVIYRNAIPAGILPQERRHIIIDGACIQSLVIIAHVILQHVMEVVNWRGSMQSTVSTWSLVAYATSWILWQKKRLVLLRFLLMLVCASYWVWSCSLVLAIALEHATKALMLCTVCWLTTACHGLIVSTESACYSPWLWEMASCTPW